MRDSTRVRCSMSCACRSTRRETAGTLERKLARGRRAGAASPSASDGRGTRAHRARRSRRTARPTRRRFARTEADIDWSASAAVIDRQVRAFDPMPGRCGVLVGRASEGVARATGDASAACGTLRASVLAVDAPRRRGRLRRRRRSCSTELQPAGGRRMSAAAFAGRARHRVRRTLRARARAGAR